MAFSCPVWKSLQDYCIVAGWICKLIALPFYFAKPVPDRLHGNDEAKYEGKQDIVLYWEIIDLMNFIHDWKRIEDIIRTFLLLGTVISKDIGDDGK